MTDYEEPRRTSDFKDRKTGLVVFGILEILIGAVSALMVPFMLVSVIMSTALGHPTATPMSIRMMIPGILVYILGAVWFIWMGIGSIRTRRWARALMLVSSWIWLITGIIGLVFWFLVMPDMYGQMARDGQMTREMVIIVKSVTALFLTVIYIVLPGIFVLFYRSRNVKATCDSRDTQVRWTDKCPLPVLALSLMFGAGALSMLFMPFYSCVVPFFGCLLSGAKGAVIVLVFAVLLGYVAWGTYKLRMPAWWAAFVLTALGGISGIITFSRVSMMELYERMDFPVQQMEIMQHGMPGNFSMVLYTGLWVAGFLGYLLYTRRFFSDSR